MCQRTVRKTSSSVTGGPRPLLVGGWPAFRIDELLPSADAYFRRACIAENQIKRYPQGPRSTGPVSVYPTRSVGGFLVEAHYPRCMVTSPLIGARSETFEGEPDCFPILPCIGVPFPR
jgi:hypothetical protein